MSSTIIPLALDLIAIPSISSDLLACRSVLDKIQAYLEGAGEIVYFNDKPSLIVANYDIEKEGKRADIVLNGHIDVVPPTQDGQFDPRIEGDKLYARGSGDMKAGVSILVEIMKNALSNDVCKKKILLLITSDEEVGGFDGAGKLTEQGRGGDVVFIPDSGDLYRFVTAEKGILNIHLQTKGIACHSSRPWLGSNAIETAYKCFEEIKSTIVDNTKLISPSYWGSTCELTIIQGGIASNTVPDLCSMTLNIRHTEEWSYEELLSKIEGIAKKYNTVVTVPLYGPLLYSDPMNKYVQRYHAIATSHLGDAVVQGREHGASDGRFFAAKGSVVILHRPTCENIHGDNEWVSIESIEPLYNILHDYIF